MKKQVIAAATAYTIAESGEQGAVKIASEVAANSAKRMSIKMKQDLNTLAGASAEEFAALYRAARFNQDALRQNEVATINSVAELAPKSKVLADYLASLTESVDAALAANSKSIDAAMRAKAAELGVGTTWVMHFDPAAMREAFAIPEDLEPVALLVMGYPAEDAAPIAMHSEFKDMDEIVSYNEF